MEINFTEEVKSQNIKTLLKNLKMIKKENGNCIGVHCISCPFEYVINGTSLCKRIETEDEIAIWQYNVKKIKKALKKLDTNKIV